jgi:serine/threonine protein kinase
VISVVMCQAAACRHPHPPHPNLLSQPAALSPPSSTSLPLQARNVLLKSAGADSRGFVAKVSDFGLSVRLDPSQTHVSNVYQVGLLLVVLAGQSGSQSGSQSVIQLVSQSVSVVVLLAPMAIGKRPGTPAGWLAGCHTCWLCPQTPQGTLTHMAPEVLMHGKISKSSDVYAFGAHADQQHLQQQQ